MSFFKISEENTFQWYIVSCWPLTPDVLTDAKLLKIFSINVPRWNLGKVTKCRPSLNKVSESCFEITPYMKLSSTCTHLP